MLDQLVHAQFAAILPPAALLTSAEDTRPYECDGLTLYRERPAAVARELTKRFEEVRRGGLEALAAFYAGTAARGEITVVLGPAAAEADEEDLDGQLLRALDAHSVKDAAALVAVATGLPRRVVYGRALALSGGGGTAADQRSR